MNNKALPRLLALPYAKLGTSLRRALILLAFVSSVFLVLEGHTAPRAPLPPYPDGFLKSWRFDTEAWITNDNTSPWLMLGTEFVESWSGHTLRMAGPEPALFALAEQAEDGTLNLSMTAPGSIRFWFAPEWSSVDRGGGGPGHPARLLEVGDWSAIGPVSRLACYVSASGTSLELAVRVSGQNLPILQAPISWVSGEWHQIALTWTPGAQTRLFIDGQWRADAASWNLPPLTAGGRALALGSDLVGEFKAQGQFDEVFTYGCALTEDAVASDYERNSVRAALGAMSPEEEETLLAATAMALAAPLSPINPGMGQFAMGAAQYGCRLWVAIEPYPEPGTILVIVHNTQPDRLYQLWSTEDLTNPNWNVEQTVMGAFGTDQTEFVVPFQNATTFRSSLFFKAKELDVSGLEYLVQTSFEGLGRVDTDWTPPDVMGAAGVDHFVELLNGKIAVYHKSGGLAAPPVLSNDFFAFEDVSGTYPQSETFDPRLLYDHQMQRWVACALDVGSRDILLAISKSESPLPLLTNWDKYRAPFSRGSSDLTDFTTLGLDAKGVYISAYYTTSLDNQIVVFDKQALYQQTAMYWVFSIGSTSPDIRIIQPAVNFDAEPVESSAWMICKGPPEYGASPYQGGAIEYRRLQWVQGAPEWADTDWIPIEDSTPSYRDYFDLDLGSVKAPQLEDELYLQSIALSGFNGNAVGGRLCMAVIRNGTLWTCHPIGLDGPDWAYNGDESGATVDRSAVQWLKLAIQPNGVLELVDCEDHGRIFDQSVESPTWYFNPSLMVNSLGDMVAGFSGSSENTYPGAFYNWRLADGTQGEQPMLLYAGEDYFLHTRWGDYSYTSLDPQNDFCFWTVQEFAKEHEPFLDTWGTIIARIVLVTP